MAPGLLLLVACAGNGVATQTSPTTGTPLSQLSPQLLDSTHVLHQSGITPNDTTIVFPGSIGRTVLLKHPDPDNAIFAIVRIPADTTTTDSTTLTLHPIPDVYGLRVEGKPELPKGSTITFSYATHFEATPRALRRYFTPARYSLRLGVGRLLPNGMLRFIAERHPADDMLRADLTSNGDYYVAAPR